MIAQRRCSGQQVDSAYLKCPGPKCGDRRRHPIIDFCIFLLEDSIQIPLLKTFSGLPLWQTLIPDSSTCVRMHISVQVISALLNLIPPLAAVPSSIRLNRSDDFTPLRPSLFTIQQELGRRLSKNASLYLPNSPGYINDTERWSAETKSNFSVVVVPAIDRDVAATVTSNSTSVYTRLEIADRRN